MKSGYYRAEPFHIKNVNKMLYQNTDMDVQAAPDFFYTTPEKTTCRSLDPRLIDPRRNIHMELDRPPYQPKNVQPLRNMYTECKTNEIRPRYYNGGYASIYGGDIQYWVDPDRAQFYITPNFVLQNATVPFVFEDPMGGLGAQYDRVPLFKNNNNVVEYSFDQDQMAFREDIMSRQTRLWNKNDYGQFYGHFQQAKCTASERNDTLY